MTTNSNEQIPVFQLVKIYAKDISVEAPHAHTKLLKDNKEQPQVDINLDNSVSQIEDGLYEVCLKGKLLATLSGETLYCIEVLQAGLFHMKNISDKDIELLQHIDCPSILYPYLQATISDLTQRSGFSPINLQPVNFASVYQDYKQQQESQPVVEPLNQTIN